MTTTEQAVETDPGTGTGTDTGTDDLSDLLPDDLNPEAPSAHEVEETASQPVASTAVRLAQVVNLHIAGYSLAEIGDSIGATADEVDRLLAQDAARYVRNQPSLRTYVRNWVSERYSAMLDADWAIATNKAHPAKLEHQDRALRILDSMRKLHGADAPVQSEVKVEAAPEAVEKLVNALAAGQGLGYDADIFDIVDAEVVHEAAVEAPGRTEVSGNAADADQDGDERGWGADDGAT